MNIPSSSDIEVSGILLLLLFTSSSSSSFSSSCLTFNAYSIDEHGISSHPHHSDVTPTSFPSFIPPTYIIDSESLALFIT